jgi:hypothetical protein
MATPGWHGSVVSDVPPAEAVDPLVAEFRRHLTVERNTSPYTVRNYGSALDEFGRWHRETTTRPPTWASISRDELRLYLRWLGRRGMDPASVALRFSALRTFFKWMVREGTRESTPVRQLRLPRLPRKLPKHLPEADLVRLLETPLAEMDRERKEYEEKQKAARSKYPAQPTRDVLLFLLKHARLDDWQQDILGIIRDEAYYFAPQAMTKVMNEGWATYWHSKLMTSHFLEAKEIVHYADQHSGVVHMAPGGFNPYKIGLEMFKDIERRWNKGQHGPAWEALDTIGAKEAFDDKSMKGRDKIFEVRRIYNDVNFIDEFLTEEFVEKHKMYQHKRDPQTGEIKVVSRDFKRVKMTLLHHLTNMGQPFIYVADANYLNRGELYLAHQFNGLEVEAAKAQQVLENLRLI